MRAILASAAALLVVAAAAAPAQAQFAAGFGSTDFRSAPQPGFGVRVHRGDDDRRRDRRGSAVVIGGYGWSDGQWALYNNRTFAPDGFNDWWHDQPHRSYPRWVANNGNCERQYWSGGGWRC